MVVEVPLPETRRIDEIEKHFAYTTMPSLCVHLLVESTTAQVVAFRRTGDGFEREEITGPEGTIPLPEIGCDLPLAEVYDGLRVAEG